MDNSLFTIFSSPPLLLPSLAPFPAVRSSLVPFGRQHSVQPPRLRDFGGNERGDVFIERARQGLGDRPLRQPPHDQLPPLSSPPGEGDAVADPHFAVGLGASAVDVDFS